MPQWKQYSGIWTPTQQAQAIAAGTWTGIPSFEIYSWGRSTDGAGGRDDAGFPAPDESSPIQIGALDDWSSIEGALNMAAAAAIRSNGTLWMWGDNAPYGILGQNDQINRSSPTQVGSLTNWASISLGYFYCHAVKTDGTLWAWGRNDLSALGDGTAINRSSPVQIGALTDWLRTADGAFGTAGAVKTDGTLWMWGWNPDGTVGQNNTATYNSPVQVGLGSTWAKLAIGQGFAATVKTDGTLWAWGTNNSGQLGVGNVVNYSSPVQIGALTNWREPIAAQYSTSHVKTDGTLWAWGDGASGQLGANNASTDRSSPVQVDAATNWLSGSGNVTGYLCLKTDGTIWGYGTNGSGRFGQTAGSPQDMSSPTQIGIETDWSSTALAKNLTAFAIKTVLT